jgi:predicted metal-dependent hydrolase
LEKHAKATIKTVIGHGRITVMFPDFADVSDHRVQKAVRKAILQAWRLEAAKYLPGLVKQLKEKNHLKFSRLTFRDNKTRWGSCSRDNKISLNIHLMRLPDHLCEYVILHELAHTVFKHHQKAFWQYRDQLTRGRARIFDKELNGYSPEVW